MNAPLIEFDFNQSWPQPVIVPESWYTVHIRRSMRAAYSFLITLAPISYYILR